MLIAPIRILSFFILITVSNPAFCCTFLQLGNQNDFTGAQNFDFPVGVSASIVVNKRNVEKTGAPFTGAPAAPPVKWISKYGSISFGFGVGNTATGVNEVGLRVFRAVFRAAKYPEPNLLPAMNESEYLSYLLDTARTIDDVIRQTHAVQVYSFGKFPTHFGVCDENAKCAIIEATNGKLNITVAPELKVAALTNTSLARSQDLLAKCNDGNCADIQNNSEWRFIEAATRVNQFKGNQIVPTTFEILDAVKQNSPSSPIITLWTLLTHVDQSEAKFIVKNTMSSNSVLTLDFKKLDYSCKTPIQVAILVPKDPNSVVLVDYTANFQNKMGDVLEGYLGESPSDVQLWKEYPGKFLRCLE